MSKIYRKLTNTKGVSMREITQEDVGGDLKSPSFLLKEKYLRMICSGYKKYEYRCNSIENQKKLKDATHITFLCGRQSIQFRIIKVGRRGKDLKIELGECTRKLK